MGQPTMGVAQRVNRSQLALHTPIVSSQDRSSGEHLFRLTLGAQLAVLACQAAYVPHAAFPWLRCHSPVALVKSTRWQRTQLKPTEVFAAYNSSRYYYERRPRFLFEEGEQVVQTLRLRTRRLRLRASL